MLPKKELLKLIECLVGSISDNTLRNYIKAGLADGASDCEGGISVRGKSTFYPMKTAFQAAIAKSMLERKNRRLDRCELVFANKYAKKILVDGEFYPGVEQLSALAKEVFEEEPSFSGYGFGTVKISAGKYQQLETLEQYAFEWIFKFVSYGCTSISRVDVLAGTKIESKPLASAILVEAKKPYLIIRKHNHDGKDDYAVSEDTSSADFEYVVEPDIKKEIITIVDGNAKYFY